MINKQISNIASKYSDFVLTYHNYHNITLLYMYIIFAHTQCVINFCLFQLGLVIIDLLKTFANVNSVKSIIERQIGVEFSLKHSF